MVLWEANNVLCEILAAQTLPENATAVGSFVIGTKNQPCYSFNATILTRVDNLSTLTTIFCYVYIPLMVTRRIIRAYKNSSYAVTQLF